MSKTLIKLFLLALAMVVAMPVHAISQDRHDEEVDRMVPPPDERGAFKFVRVPGQFKRTPMGFLDTSPDVAPLEHFPKDNYGFVDWAKAIKNGLIAPRGFISNTDKPSEQEIDKEENTNPVLIRSKLEFMPDVIFPHAAHTTWLKCSTCHTQMFELQAGATPITMAAIWRGQYCGRCHDKVAFPLRNCFKCHSAPRSKQPVAQTGLEAEPKAGVQKGLKKK